MADFRESKIYNVTMIVVLYMFILAWVAGVTAVVIDAVG